MAAASFPTLSVSWSSWALVEEHLRLGLVEDRDVLDVVPGLALDVEQAQRDYESRLREAITSLTEAGSENGAIIG
ncbi:MAG: hypothetical protein ABWX60_07585 [Aeromicrobium sp.]